MAEKHIRDSKNCPACCCGGSYSHKNCGGNWHERVVNDDPEDGFVHNYKCDKCDVEEFYPRCEDLKIEFRD